MPAAVASSLKYSPLAVGSSEAGKLSYQPAASEVTVPHDLSELWRLWQRFALERHPESMADMAMERSCAALRQQEACNPWKDYHFLITSVDLLQADVRPAARQTPISIYRLFQSR